MKRLIAVLMMLVMVVGAGCNKKQESGAGNAAAVKPAEGSVAPDFTVKDLAGKEVKLSDLRGNVVLVNFWATWCPPCREEIPSMMKLNKAMEGKPFRLLAISIDDGRKSVDDYFAKSGQSLPTYLDSEQTVAGLYGTTGVPETFVLDKKGVIVKKVIGAMDWSSPDVAAFLTNLMNQ